MRTYAITVTTGPDRYPRVTHFSSVEWNMICSSVTQCVEVSQATKDKVLRIREDCCIQHLSREQAVEELLREYCLDADIDVNEQITNKMREDR